MSAVDPIGMQMHQIVVWAAETTGGAASTDPLQLLLQYGVLGIFAVLMILYTRGSIAREREKSDRCETQVHELNNFIRQELLPKQIEAALLYKQVAEVLGEAVQVITEMKIRENLNRQVSGPPYNMPSGGPRG